MKIWDAFGRLIGTVKKLENGDQNTYDNQGQRVGSVRKTGTFDKSGRKISSTTDAGLTLRVHRDERGE
jgi:YD repeat-containing protein